MKKSLFFLLLIFCTAISLQAQKNLNGSFEQINPAAQSPLGWLGGTGQGTASTYPCSLDSSTAREGRYSYRIESTGSAQDFGSFFQSIPAYFAGEKLVLKGWIKTENVSAEGWAGLWLRIDGESGTLDFDNMYGRGAQGTTDWQEFSIELPFDDEARNILVGALLVGSGKAWFDDLQFFADGKPWTEAPVRVIARRPAELDTAFNQGSAVKLGTLSPQRIDDLVLLGQVWGFLKYYHPAIAAGQYNWDYELFRFLPRYQSATNPADRDRLLVQWIESLGELPVCNKCPLLPEGEVALPADWTWIDKQDKALWAALHQVLDNSNISKNYYITHDQNIGNPKFLHENAYKQFSYPDEGFRLLALYRFWNMIQYFFPYRDVIGENWSGVLREFVPRMAGAGDALQYKLALRELIGRVHDTHANLWVQDEELRSHFGRLRPAAQVKFIENQAVVTGYYHAELGPKSGLLPGDVITAVDGIPVQKIVDQKLSLYPASNLPTKLRDIAKDLLRTNNAELRLDLRRGSEKLHLKVPTHDAKLDNLDLGSDWAWTRPDSCYRLLNPNIGYLNLGVVKQEVFPVMMEKFKHTKGLIIDIRNYPAEFVVFSLNRYLKCKPSEFVRFTAGSVQNPGVFTLTPALTVGEDNPDCYQGKIVVLVNEISQSQAEYTTMALRSAGAVVVGSTTAGADGNVSEILLPGGMRSMISGIGVFYPDGTPTQRVGIVPDVEVRPSIEGIRAGRDELLEYAMRLIERP